MQEYSDYQVGDRVRLTCDLPAGPVGTEGIVRQVVRDGQQQVTALNILVHADQQRIYGTTVFLREVELVCKAKEVGG